MRSMLMAARGRVVTLSRYVAGEHQVRHTDRHSRITLVLQGGFQEESGLGVLRMGPGELLLKSRRVAHEDTFGEAGALLLSLEFVADDPFESDGPLWRRPSAAGATRVAMSLLEAALANDDSAVEAAGNDILAAGTVNGRRAAPPRWLSRLRLELEGVPLSEVDVAARAREAGVHPAHASRLFRRCFGTSATEFAQAHAVRRAIGLLVVRGAALSDVALAAGFYDQSHMNRVFVRVSGRPPGAHRALVDRAASLSG